MRSAATAAAFTRTDRFGPIAETLQGLENLIFRDAPGNAQPAGKQIEVYQQACVDREKGALDGKSVDLPLIGLHLELHGVLH